ncbi:MAG: hydrogenase maturation protease [Spirochaetota bacterium]
MIDTAGKKILVIGFGNPAREDDGLGPKIAEKLESYKIEGVTVDIDYQLTVEEAAAVAEHDTVIFMDASVDGEEPFTFSKITPQFKDSFSSHSITPEAVVGLAKELFNSEVEAYMLGIRGYSFSMFNEELTEKAGENMEKAYLFLVSLLSKDSIKPCSR